VEDEEEKEEEDIVAKRYTLQQKCLNK